LSLDTSELILRFETILIEWLAFAAIVSSTARGQSVAPSAQFEMNPKVGREDVLNRTLRPYHGTSTPGVSNQTLYGKVMCGYQGWFTCPGDGSGRGWYHWGKHGEFEPGSCRIDLWPDVSELDADERYDTSFRLPDGSTAQVFSSLNAKTVDRHFKWMKEFGIDGVFVQRFGTEIRDATGLYHFNTVLSHCRAGANQHGRTWAVMYDLSGLERGETKIIMEDWKQLVDRFHVGRDATDKAYLHHRNKPLVAVWGIGFNDGRQYSLEECAQLVDFLAHDPKYGGNCVMIGVPAYWRTLRHDCVSDPRVHEIVKSADIVSPWSVGRFGTVEDVDDFNRKVWQPDLEWCKARGLDYLPVVFPGFSWHNMRADAPLDQIPRHGGRFLWRQFTALRDIGANMVYQAMFDEVDEGTGIFKCTNQPPVGISPFLDYEGLPTDHYLSLVGQGGRLIRGEIESTAMPDVRGKQ
jgi:hypothetical protein